MAWPPPAPTGKIPILRENFIRDSGGERECSLLDFWHRLCREVLGGDLEVILFDSKLHPLTKHYEGDISIGVPRLHRFGPCIELILVFEEEGVDENLVAHELCHPILRLQGFTVITPREDPTSSDLAILLGSLADHVPLNAFLRRHGFTPQAMIDGRARRHIEVYRNSAPIRGKEPKIRAALVVADDLFNCSEALSLALQGVVQQHHKNIWPYVHGLLMTKKRYDLLDPDGHKAFARSALQNLNIGHDWVPFDNVAELRRIARSSPPA